MVKIGPIKKENYRMPTTVYFGRRALDRLPEILQKQAAQNILLVAGGHLREEPQFQKIIADLQKERQVSVYEPKIKKSDYTLVDNLTEFCRQNQFDTLIAVGGGTILDAGKCAAILAVHQGKIEDYVKDRIRELEKKGITFVAIPTTAGTGSEVTPWATVWGDDLKKYSLTDKLMFPDLAIVDPSLTDELPAKVTAESGIDALTQAIEAYWSVKHNPVSDEFALEAIKLAMVTLEKVVNNPDQESRDKMSKAALLAGLAFSNTQTTICHAVSYPMTAHFGVAHGQAVAITLPTFIEYTLPVLGERKTALLLVLGAQDENEAAQKITVLMKSCGLATKLSQLGIKEEDLDLIVNEGFHPDRAKNAPRIPTPKELKEMLCSFL